MSIIHDALKKVQQNTGAGAPVPPPVPPPENFSSPDPVKAQEKINIPLMVAALCAVVAMIFAILPRITPQKTAVVPAPAVAAPEVKPAPEPAHGQQPAPAPSTNTMSKAVADAVASPAIAPTNPPAAKIIDPNDPLSSIQIEGILDMNGKKVALISGNVYEEGQTIYGFIISEITFDELTVIENGQKRVLRTKP